MTLYQWIVLLHILFAFLFFFVYGISMATAFLLLNEKDVKRISMLLDVPSITIALMGLSMLGLLVTSIYMGSVGKLVEQRLVGCFVLDLFGYDRLDDLVWT